MSKPKPLYASLSPCLHLFKRRRSLPIPRHPLQLCSHSLRPQPAIACTAEGVEQLLEIGLGPGRFTPASEGQGDFFLGGLAVLRQRGNVGGMEGEEGF